MNSIVLIGRLTQEPELRYTQSGTPVCGFRIAVNRIGAKEGQQQADFINIVCWNKSAENAGNHLVKGQRVGVRGRLQIRQYEDNQGNKRWVTEVVAGEVEFLDKPQGSQGNNTGAEESEGFASEISFNEEEIPF